MALKFSFRDNETYSKLEHQRLASLINNMADAVIAVDENVNILEFNSSTLNILDVNTINVGTPLKSLFKPIDKNNQEIDIDNLIKNTSVATTNRDLRLSYKDGSLINLYISIAPVRLGYGEKGEKGYVMLLRDITREKSLEDERDEFISVVSHELRTPVTIAEGNLSNAKILVNNTSDHEKMRKAIEDAHNQILFLSEMINDLATLSRAERGVLKVDVNEINVPDLINELQQTYFKNAKDKGLDLKTVIDPNLSHLYSSKLYVREILQNFITNSIKYTEKGEVVIHGENHSGGIMLSVHDSGIGISKADQERVFDKFYRSEDYRTRKANGTGLGLYVTYKLARLIHANIYLDSELNRGSTFSIFIPNLR